MFYVSLMSWPGGQCSDSGGVGWLLPCVYQQSQLMAVLLCILTCNPSQWKSPEALRCPLFTSLWGAPSPSFFYSHCCLGFSPGWAFKNRTSDGEERKGSRALETTSPSCPPLVQGSSGSPVSFAHMSLSETFFSLSSSWSLSLPSLLHP